MIFPRKLDKIRILNILVLPPNDSGFPLLRRELKPEFCLFRLTVVNSHGLSGTGPQRYSIRKT